jgi:hypothetical protein
MYNNRRNRSKTLASVVIISMRLSRSSEQYSPSLYYLFFTNFGEPKVMKRQCR